MIVAKYADGAGKNARFAAELAMSGDAARAMKKAALAAADLELMHPKTWESWAEAKNEIFVQALSKILPEELKILNAQKNRHGLSCFAFFSFQPAKAAALLAAGVDPAAGCELYGVACTAVERTALMGDFARLAGMMDAGAPPSYELSSELAKRVAEHCRSGPKTTVQALAENSLHGTGPAGGRWAWSASGLGQRANEVIKWLADGSRLDKRNALGLDALKIAIAAGNFPFAKALLEAGASPLSKDAKGQDALGYLHMLAKSGVGTVHPGMEELRARLLAHAELRDLDGAAACVATEPRRKPARSLSIFGCFWRLNVDLERYAVAHLRGMADSYAGRSLGWTGPRAAAEAGIVLGG